MGPIDVSNIRLGLPRFIELLCEGLITPRFGWQTFVATWQGHPAVVSETRYEDLLRDCAGELMAIAAACNRPLAPAKASLIAAKYSFENQTRRKPGQEDKSSFLRKGIVGDWRNFFSVESAQLFDRYCGEALVALGYEPDRQWVERFAREVPASGWEGK